jgi:tRNA 5-methylaminomethyl-2-thiouridine biosynthesis bifunctional protein
MIDETLPQARFAADAWFLDGFSPAKNQAMWGEALWPLIAERSAPGARAATFTVAGAVRRGLATNGFEVAKRPGHGRKRERLEATYKSSPKTSSSDPAEPLRVGVLGAGIAGACLAYFLRQRGAHVSVFDPANGPCEGTSGNPLALVMPRLDAGDTVQARLLIDAYLSAQSFYRGRPGVSPAETVHHPRNSQEAERFEKLLSDPPLGLRQLETIQGGGLLHKGSLAIRPADLLPSLLAGATMKWGEPPTVDLTARTINDERFDAILIANGWHMAELFPELDITGRLGQIEWLDSGVEAPASAMARGDYAIASGRTRLWGATFAGHNGGPALTSDAARAKNQAALEALAPYWVGEARTAKVSSRAGIRATTADRLPLIGPAPDLAALQADRKQLERAQWSAADNAYLQPGIYLAGGFGSRGFTWAPWAASILTARLFDDPAPTRLEALQAIVPNRQILRQMKRNSL